MRNAPNSWQLSDLVEAAVDGPNYASRNGRDYFPARPVGFFSLQSRLRIAWAVFKGDADAVFWDEKPIRIRALKEKRP